MAYVSDISIAEFLYRKDEEGFFRIRDDAPEWAKQEYERRRRAGIWDPNNPIKVE